MNPLAQEFYQTSGKEEGSFFHSAIFLPDSSESWDQVKEKCPSLPRGWYELSRLVPTDRISFTRDFWMDRMVNYPAFCRFLLDFFARLDDVGVVLAQTSQGAPWIAEKVYSLKENRSFFRGLLPGSDSDIEELKCSAGVHLPRDYLSFLHIHNGFGKLSELGLMSTAQAIEAREELLNSLLSNEKHLMHRGRVVDPKSLIPFFKSFGVESYQCFFAEWYPGSEMGNVYLSGIDYTMSDCASRNEWVDQLAFPTFLDWMTFYLEGNSLNLSEFV